MQEIKMLNTEQVHVHLAPVRTNPDGTTEPAEIDGKVTYTVTNDGDATVLEEGTAGDGSVIDNLNPMFVSGNSAMETKIMATADADLGEGVVEISQEFSVVVSLPQATGFGVTVDAPELKPEPEAKAKRKSRK